MASKLKVKNATRAQQKAATSGSTDLAQKTDVSVVQGYVAPPVIKDGGATNADFYRYGLPGFIQHGVIDDFDDKPASIRVLQRRPSGEDKDLIPVFTKFILESAREAHVEKAQIVETFGDWYVFFFGERPSTYSFSGTLINSKTNNWLQDFMFYYNNYLRGTKCVENQARILLTYGGRQIEGFILNAQTQTQAANEKGVPFSFDVLITERKVLNLSPDIAIVVNNGKLVGSEPFLELLKNTSNGPVSSAYVTAKQALGLEKRPKSTDELKGSDLEATSDRFGIKGLIRSATGGLKIG